MIVGGEGTMSAAGRLEPLDWEAYLEGEERAERKHEYQFGDLYAMAEAPRQHQRIVGNIYHALRRQLDGSPCEPFSSEMKVRIRAAEGFCFYYPDVAVECGAHDAHSAFTDDPVVIVEVLSASTRRIDEREKKAAYLTIPSLAAYAEPSAGVALPEIGATLPLEEVYAKVEWEKEQAEEEET
jgi:Uma2 family endonuclease